MNTKVITLFSLFIAFFILIFVTRPFLYTLQANLDMDAQATLQEKEKKEELNKLNAIRDELKAGTWEDLKEVKKFSQSFTEDKIVNYIYSYLNDVGGLALVREIGMEEGDINEYGFKQGQIQLDLRVADEAAMLNLIEYLTNPPVPQGDEEMYTFFIDNFTYASSGIPGSFNISVPLKVFYK